MVSVSVIIPNYNRAQVIGETIDNMLSQTLPPAEVIVVDDGSTDESVDVIRSFGDRVTLLKQFNQGPGAARNAGLKVAVGDFIQFMDSDDLASLNKLEVQAQALLKHKADIVYGPWVKAWMSNQRIRPENVVLQQRPLPVQQHPLHWFLTQWSMVFQQCLVRRSVLTAVNGYREDMRLYEDGDLFVRLILFGAKLVHEGNSLTFYRLEDYGKLTASGEQSHIRLKDTLCFYERVIQQIQQHPQLKPILSHLRFRMTVWQMCQQACATSDLDGVVLGSKVLEQLESYGASNSLRIWAWLDSKKQGFQQRLYGHRWPSCYQTGKLTAHQHSLIQAMGRTFV